MKLLITGGAGFIGSGFLNRFVPAQPSHQFLTVDSLSYAGNLDNLSALAQAPNHFFESLDISDREQTFGIVQRFQPNLIVHFAAETHVDRAIAAPAPFVQANILGTFHLLEAARTYSLPHAPIRFLQVSTDEVYGSLGLEAPATLPGAAYHPRNPYSATKAAGDHLVEAWANTYGLRAAISHCSNNYGPRQFPEKLLPFMLLRLLEGQSLPLYGAGTQRRDWLFVDDHVEGLWKAIEYLMADHVSVLPVPHFHFSAHDERPNLELVTRLCERMLTQVQAEPSVLEAWPNASGLRQASLKDLLNRVTFIPDRPGHDTRYALETSQTQALLNWRPRTPFEEGLELTLHWYLTHPQWLQRVRTGEYRRWVDSHYGQHSVPGQPGLPSDRRPLAEEAS